jgi:hypothetical protein
MNCKVLETNTHRVLVSYSTVVAIHTKGTLFCLVTNKKWSNTTSKHIGAFLRSEDFTPQYVTYLSQEEIDQLASELNIPTVTSL